MRVVVTSDLHGFLPDIPACDLLLIAGDLCPIDDHDVDFQNDWLRTRFIPWLRAAPARRKVFIAGNHDFIFALAPHLLSDVEWPGTYLQDGGLVWEGRSIWGSPWANELPGWPFTAPEEDLQIYWDEIPIGTDILMVHGPPHGFGDVVLGRLSGDELHVGSRSLMRTLDRLPNLRLFVFGHIHEAAGIFQYERITLVNAALMNVSYEPTQPIRVLELP